MAGYTGKRRLAVATPIGHRQPELVAEEATCPTCGGPAELGLPYTSSTPDETVVKRVGTCKNRNLRKHTPTKYKSERCPSWIVIGDAVETVTSPTLPRFAKGDEMESKRKNCRCSPICSIAVTTRPDASILAFNSSNEPLKISMPISIATDLMERKVSSTFKQGIYQDEPNASPHRPV